MEQRMTSEMRIALTGFMGVGKTSVSRHLAKALGCRRLDLDDHIEKRTGRKIPDIIRQDGEPAYRLIETAALEEVLAKPDVRILSLGGGVWTVETNRELIHSGGFTSVWLESTFEHCWQNIRKSRKERPLANNRGEALRLFESRQAVYCLADWHFIVRPELSSYEVAAQIAEEMF
ncbi:MAG: shikimate kinase [Acidobacteria bacterium]|nr:shikimate kinase [Acidobacteriota bacterium]